MRNALWLRITKLSMAVVFVAGSIGLGSAAAHQGSESVWTELGAGFETPGNDAPANQVVGDTYVLPSSGAEVVVGAGVSADDPAGSDVEDQVIVTSPDGLGAVAVITGIGRPVTTLDAYIGGFGESMDSVTEIDRHEDRFLATGIYRVVNGGQTTYLVISVDAATSPGNHIVQVVIAGAEVLDDQIALLRANVTIDGVPMFNELDETDMLEIVLQDDASQ